MADIPLHIMENILLRLPVKSLLRFRCVCKAWCDLISHPQFAKTHLQHPQKEAKSRLCIINSEEEKNDGCRVVRVCTKDWESIRDYKGDRGLLEFDYSLGDVNLKDYVLLSNCCDGLLCLVDTLGNIVLWNPSTRQYNPLPPNPNAPKDTAYALGYDCSGDDYKIVGVYSLGYTYDCETLVDVFSLKSREWRRIQTKHPTEFVYWWQRRYSVVLHGAMHWTADDHSCIVAFDFEKEEFRQMRIAEDGDLRLFVSGGCLCVPCFKDPRKMWVMKEYGVETSWTRMDFPDWTWKFLDGTFKCQGLKQLWVSFTLRNLQRRWFDYSANLYVESLVSPFPS